VPRESCNFLRCRHSVAYCFYQPGCLRHLGDGRYRKSKKDSLIASRELLRLVRIELAHNGGRLHSRTFTERNRVYGHAHIENAWRIYRTLAPIGIAGLGLRMRSGSYRALQEKNGGDTRAGRKLASWLEAGGFSIRIISGNSERESSAQKCLPRCPKRSIVRLHSLR
jgi:hypothetical protein